MMVADTEAGYPIIGVRNNFAVRGQVSHQDTLGISFSAESRFDFCSRFRMPDHILPRCGGSTLAGMVIRRGADPAETENNIATGQRPAQGFSYVRRIVADDLTPFELQA